jgi:hypothetical protein
MRQRSIQSRLLFTDPVSSPIDFAFFALALVFLVWVAIDTRRVLEFLFFRAKPLSDGLIVSLRVLAALCVCGLSVLLITHLAGYREPCGTSFHVFVQSSPCPPAERNRIAP